MEGILNIIKAQLDSFHRVVENNSKDAKVQAQYWALIAEHEAVIAKIKSAMLSEQYNRSKKNGPNYTRSKKSIQKENIIYNTIESNGGTATFYNMINSFTNAGLNMNQSMLYYYLASMVNERRIKRISKGVYAINNINGDIKNEIFVY